ncbi:MAG: hypothetical protein AAF748_13235 [Pseudomonadota bacterium]
MGRTGHMRRKLPSLTALIVGLITGLSLAAAGEHRFAEDTRVASNLACEGGDVHVAELADWLPPYRSNIDAGPQKT